MATIVYDDFQMSIFDQQHQRVIKSLDLIRKSRYSLSAQEQKIVLYLISKIKPTDSDFKEYEFNIVEFCKVCGIDYRSGRNFELLKDTIKTLRDKSFWLKIGKKEVTCSWIKKASVEVGESTITIQLDEDLKPHLLQLQRYTSYELSMTLSMKGKYSIRLYEILKSYSLEGSLEIELATLREQLNTANYAVFKDFRRNVLDKAIKEINFYTDIDVAFEPKRDSHAIAAILFTIRRKEGF